MAPGRRKEVARQLAPGHVTQRNQRPKPRERRSSNESRQEEPERRCGEGECTERNQLVKRSGVLHTASCCRHTPRGVNLLVTSFIFARRRAELCHYLVMQCHGSDSIPVSVSALPQGGWNPGTVPPGSRRLVSHALLVASSPTVPSRRMCYGFMPVRLGELEDENALCP